MLLECVPLKWEQDEERGLRDRNDLGERVDVCEGQRNQVDPDVYGIQDDPRDQGDLRDQRDRENQGDQER